MSTDIYAQRLAVAKGYVKALSNGTTLNDLLPNLDAGMLALVLRSMSSHELVVVVPFLGDALVGAAVEIPERYLPDVLHYATVDQLGAVCAALERRDRRRKWIARLKAVAWGLVAISLGAAWGRAVAYLIQA